MNPLPAIAVYAALQRAGGEPLHFPGTETRRTLHEAVDADIVGRGLLWAATSPDAADGTFNLTNGDVFCWDDVWPVIAATFGLEVGERRPMSFARDLPARDPEWSALAEEHNLDVPPTIEGFVGANSLVYADVVMAETGRSPFVNSTIAARHAGFAELCRHGRHVRGPHAPPRGRRTHPATALRSAGPRSWLAAPRRGGVGTNNG